MLDILWGVGGFLGGLAVSVIAPEFAKGLGSERFIKLGAAVRAKLAPRRPPLSSEDYFSFGTEKTGLIVIDGDGEMSYRPETLDLIYRGGSPACPDDVLDRITSEQRRLETEHEAGRKDFWDGVGAGLSDFKVLRPNDERALGLRANFYTSRYAEFRATVVTIGSEDRSSPTSIWQQHLQNADFNGQPVDYLARHVGIAALLITKDRRALFAKRDEGSGARPGEYDVSVVEGIEPTKDCIDVGSLNKLSIYLTVARGCREELGYDPSIDEINVVGFAVDTRFYQYNFIVVIYAKETFAEIERKRPGRVSAAWELKKREAVDFSPQKMVRFVRSNPMWAFAKITAYWALVNKFGRGGVDHEIFGQYHQSGTKL